MKRDKPQDSLDDYKLSYEDMPKESNRVKPIKSLTNKHKWRIMERVRKLIRKENKMLQDKTKKQKGKMLNPLKSVVWLTFAVQQAFSGYVLMSNFDNYFVVACALVSLGIAGVVVVSHFVRANR